jgi:hypothetical protein
MSKPVGLSRGPQIDTEACVEQVGNRFNLVLVASTRAREIKRSHSNSDKREHIHSNITALLEIQEGKIGEEYLKRVK